MPLDGVLGMGMEKGEKAGRYTWSNKSFYGQCEGQGSGHILT